jgi:pyruvate ferredoxin oxidoreductase delta subunit
MKIKQGSTWRDVPNGGAVLEPGTSKEYNTGSWRSQRPVWSDEKCIQCSMCWMQCPDVAIVLDENDKVAGMNYEYCKGCGLCAKVCPPKANAIYMKPESEGE